jgi:hypothetical protein
MQEKIMHLVNIKHQSLAFMIERSRLRFGQRAGYPDRCIAKGPIEALPQKPIGRNGQDSGMHEAAAK